VAGIDEAMARHAQETDKVDLLTLKKLKGRVNVLEQQIVTDKAKQLTVSQSLAISPCIALNLCCWRMAVKVTTPVPGSWQLALHICRAGSRTYARPAKHVVNPRQGNSEGWSMHLQCSNVHAISGEWSSLVVICFVLNVGSCKAWWQGVSGARPDPSIRLASILPALALKSLERLCTWKMIE